MNAAKCHAMTVKQTSNVIFLDMEDFRAEAESTLAATPCSFVAQYKIGSYQSCQFHLAALIVDQEGDWDGDMIAVQLLARKPRNGS